MVDWSIRSYCRNCETYRMRDELEISETGVKKCPVCHYRVRLMPRNASSRHRREQKLIRRIP